MPTPGRSPLATLLTPDELREAFMAAVVDASAEAARRVWLTWRPGRALMPRLAYLHAHVLVDEWEAFVAHHAAGCRL